MKRLWQAVLDARANGIRESDIFLDVADTSSPYGEATVKNAYTPFGPFEGHVAVNPYYSYESIFSPLIKPGRIPELTAFLCDLILHHLWETDAYSGMDLEAFYVRFLEDDIRNNALGSVFAPEAFTEPELRQIAYYYLRLCRTNDYESCFCRALQGLYKNAWVNVMENGGIVAILNIKKTPKDERRVHSIQNIFLQAGRICRIFWDVPPGIIECRETTIGNFLLF